jgi:multiple sugar transport system substrate-binding protein
MSPLRVAVIGGAQYDQVKSVIAAFTAATGRDVEVAFRGDHVALNQHLGIALSSGDTYDLVSTHSKYAPSQAAWLTPLDELLSADEFASFVPGAVQLCRVDGRLWSLPRNIDARLLFVNRDLVDDDWSPTSWPHLLESAMEFTKRTAHAAFAFPTRDSGLFGTFYELTAAFGGSLFDSAGAPCLDSSEAEAALAWMVDACSGSRVTPARMVTDEWYFDEISSGFRSGAVAMIGDWPGYYSLLSADPSMKDRVRVLRYPPGVDQRRYVYAGCHSWAIPASAADVGASLELLRFLTSLQAGRVDAAAGMVPVRVDVSMPVEHALDAQRAELLEATVATDLLTFPSMTAFPAIEDAAAASLRSALLGESDVHSAVAAAQADAMFALGL